MHIFCVKYDENLQYKTLYLILPFRKPNSHHIHVLIEYSTINAKKVNVEMH